MFIFAKRNEGMIRILYIHGMGGGGDSRIPKILSREMAGEAEVFIRTYDFDPDRGAEQIASWVDEIRPDLVVGESLGAIQAMRVHGMPHLYVSPSLGAPSRIGLLSALSLIPGLTALFNRIWKPREGDRQVLDFRHEILRKYPSHGSKALANAPFFRKNADPAYAFFGAHDHYRRNGVVSIRKWRKFFGTGSYTIYDGTHFMEEEYVLSLLIPKIRAMYSENSRK